MSDQEIISNTIPSFEIIHTYNETHFLCRCTVADFLHLDDISNWEYNRPPDQIRCKEIAKYIYKTQSELDGLFYIVFDSEAKSLKIIDGIHRFSALQIIQKENAKQVDYITPNFFGHDGNATWFYEKHVLISIRCNPTMGETVDLFQSLNKSNPIPELYMENHNTNQDKREIIEDIVRDWTTKFKVHFSANQKANIPNINRDRFIELVDCIYTKYQITKDTRHVLSEKLYDVNNHIRINIPRKTSDKAIAKCRETGCFLFLLRKEILEDLI